MKMSIFDGEYTVNDNTYFNFVEEEYTYIGDFIS